MLPIDGEGKPQEPYPFVQSRFAEGGAVFSPDGRWVAYVSNETGRNEVYVRAFSPSGGRWPISNGGGNEITWPHPGRELFYRNGATLLAVDIRTTPAFAAGKPRRLFEHDDILSTSLWANYDTSDGQRFLVIRPAGPQQARPHAINVMLNWPETLRRRAGQDAQ